MTSTYALAMRIRVRWLATVLSILLTSCWEREGEPDITTSCHVIGRAGAGPGEFMTPRGLCTSGDALWVVDRSGRVQAFDRQGRFLRSVQVMTGDRGFPIGLLGDAQGGFLLCDTHASRLRRFAKGGEERGVIAGPGLEPGRFTYPQRATRDAAGRLYVSEFGEGDSNRIQVFDREDRFLFAFGGPRPEQGGLRRPMGLVTMGDELFVTDISDRLVVYRADGVYLRSIGRTGKAAGALRYPYGLATDGEWLYVAEYGNHRVQRFRRDGTSGGVFGSAGRGAGQFSGPWDLTFAADGTLWVCDSGNHRIVGLLPDQITWQGSAF